MRNRDPDDAQAHVSLTGNENGATVEAVVTEMNRGPVDDRLKRLVRLLAQQAAEEFLRDSIDERRGHRA